MIDELAVASCSCSELESSTHNWLLLEEVEGAWHEALAKGRSEIYLMELRQSYGS